MAVKKFLRTSIQSCAEKTCTKFNAPSFCNRLQQNHVVFIAVLRKDHCLRGIAKFHQLVKYSLISSRNWMHAMSDVTLHCERGTSDSWRSAANKDFANCKRMDCWKIIVEFPAKQWHMLFDFLRIIESTGFAERLSYSDRRRSEWTDSISSRFYNLNCSQDGQPGYLFLGWKCFRQFYNVRFLANFSSVITALKMSPVFMLLSSSLTSCQTQ